MTEKIPKWAMTMANSLPIHGDGAPDEDDMQTIASALVEAERRGKIHMRERAAGAAWLQSKQGSTHDQIAAAIRQLGVDE